MLRAKFTETGSVEEDFLNFNIVFLFFRYYLPLGKGRGTSFEQT